MPNRSLFRPLVLASVAIIAILCSHPAGGGTACVWRVTSVSQPFYLVGTVHALSGTDYPLPKAYDEALHNSQKLIFEIKPDPKSDFPDKFGIAAAYPHGDDIRHHVHGKTWEFLAKNYGYSGYFSAGAMVIGNHHLGGIEEVKPWAVAYMIWGVRGYNDIFSEHGVDNHLAFEGRRMGKELDGLETTEEHIAVLSGMSDLESELILLDAIVRGDKRRDDFNTVRAAWKKGDTATIWADEQRFRKIDPGADARLLDLRNVKWIPRIKAEMKSGKPTAIIAGCAHFVGYNGVVSLLERGGYKVEQL